MTRTAGRALGWLIGLLALGVTLRLVASGDLAGPPIGSLGDLTDWGQAREPAVAAVALVRLTAEVTVWYLLAVSVLHAVASLLRATGGHRLADAIATPGVRRFVRAGLGIGLAAASSVGAPEQTGAPGTVTMTPVAASPVVAENPIEDRGGTATMQPHATPPTPLTPTGVAETGVAQTGVSQMAPAPPSIWTVAPGESLWTIAQDVMSDAWQRQPTDAETDPFWRALVERNRDRLVDPTDPGLIHPGQVFEVPPLPPVA